IGGFASGTIAGVLSRHYHGLLLAALRPPVGRTLTLAKLDETVIYDGRIYRLFANAWEDGGIEPRGFDLIDSFRLEGTIPVWTFALADALIEKRIWMEQGANTTYIRYTLLRASRPASFTFKAIVNYRDYHGNTRLTGTDNWQMQITTVEHGLRIVAGADAVPFCVLTSRAAVTPQHTWYRGYYKAIEDERGQETIEDHLYAGDFELTLQPGQSATLIATTEGEILPDTEAALQRQIDHEQRLLKTAGATAASDVTRHLLLAADQFVVRRGEGHTVIAGYPWFSDWGRDTMIALPGLTLSTGRYEIAASILRTFAKHVDQGMLPNRFPDEDEAPEYNTVDATLWYFEAICAYHAATADNRLVQELFPILQEIVAWHRRGTRYHIHVDPEDGLLYAGEVGVQLTWMDAKVGDWVVTPRIGKPVEINALWYNALRIMADFATLLKLPGNEFTTMADQIQASFQRFWNSKDDYCVDVLDGPHGTEQDLRPNQLFAVSLHHSPLTPEQQRSVVDVCARSLLTPRGLRSLTRDNATYIGIYTGNQLKRDGAYHQGTVWSWLIGAFVEAHLRVYNDLVLARSYLEPLLRHMEDAGVGSISE
ncbi:MAG TPA: amylo-alpha-1,6-glucosidase, partial [Phototrophicaceae bacterium]|nr:amylo-alpha-1,6-glucosidase [Phototrophicaceae bacterium]